jgi:hypothetical protein
MADDEIQQNIRNALSAIIAGEKQTLHSQYNKSDEEHRQRVAKLKPVMATLQAIKDEVKEHPEIEISISPHGHMATVSLKKHDHRFSISTNYGFSEAANEYFTVEEYQYFDFSGDSSEKAHRLKTEDEVIRLVLEAIGKHIALKQAVDERNQKSK